MGNEQLVTDKAAKICKEKSMSGLNPGGTAVIVSLPEQ